MNSREDRDDELAEQRAEQRRDDRAESDRHRTERDDTLPQSYEWAPTWHYGVRVA